MTIPLFSLEVFKNRSNARGRTKRANAFVIPQ